MLSNQKLIGGAFLVISLFAGLMLWQLATDDSLYISQIEEFRKTKDAQFLTRPYPKSPIHESLRNRYQGLVYFPVQHDLFIKGRFQRTAEPQFTDQDGPFKAGTVTFEYLQQTYQLTSYWQRADSDTILFIPFKDPSNQSSTYEGGRYLNASLQPDGFVELDFNKCYNPWCAYSYGYNCPFPPPENTLPFAINAGEKRFPYKPYQESSDS